MTKAHQYPMVTDETKTVGAAGDFATIQEAIDWFKYRQVGGSCYIDVDAGTYDEAVVFANVPVVPGATLTLRGDTRALAGLSFVDGAAINAEGLANGGSGTGALANAGAVITVTGTVSNPDFDADGWVAGDKVLIFDNAAATTEYTIAATLNNTITLTVAAPAVGNDSTSITLLPNRRIERTSAGPCIDVDAVSGVFLQGWYLDAFTGADCHGIYVRNRGLCKASNISACLCEDYGIYIRGMSYFYADAALSFISCGYGVGVNECSFASVTYAVVQDSSIGLLCQAQSHAFYRYSITVNQVNYGFYSYYDAFIDCRYAWARFCANTGYYVTARAYMYAVNTNANNWMNGANYSGASDVLHNSNSSITWS